MRHEDPPTEEESFDFGVDENGLYVGEEDDWIDEDDDFDDDDDLDQDD
jgi:23S rRNA pseudouridine1911/1915/1917 synthase